MIINRSSSTSNHRNVASSHKKNRRSAKNKALRPPNAIQIGSPYEGNLEKEIA
jgi:hypothetical protein